MYPSSKSGQMLVGLLMASVVMGVMVLAFGRIIGTQVRASRHVAALGNSNNASLALDSLLTSKNQCKASSSNGGVGTYNFASSNPTNCTANGGTWADGTCTFASGVNASYCTKTLLGTWNASTNQCSGISSTANTAATFTLTPIAPQIFQSSLSAIVMGGNSVITLGQSMGDFMVSSISIQSATLLDTNIQGTVIYRQYMGQLVVGYGALSDNRQPIGGVPQGIRRSIGFETEQLNSTGPEIINGCSTTTASSIEDICTALGGVFNGTTCEPGGAKVWKLLNIKVLGQEKFFPNGWYVIDLVNGFKTVRVDADADGIRESTCLDRNNNDILDAGDAPNICQGNDGLPYSQLPAQKPCTHLTLPNWEGCPYDTTAAATYLALGNTLMVKARMDLRSDGASHATIAYIIMNDLTISGPDKLLTVGFISADVSGTQTTTAEMKAVVIPGHNYRIRIRVWANQYRISSSASFSRMSNPIITIYDWLAP